MSDTTKLPAKVMRFLDKESRLGSSLDTPSPEAAPQAQLVALDPSQPLEPNLRALSQNPQAAIDAFGIEWAGWCATTALQALAAPVSPQPLDVKAVARIGQDGRPFMICRPGTKFPVGTPLYAAPLDVEALRRDTERMTEDEWYDLAQRHVNADWNSDQPDGYLNAVKALVRDAMSPPGYGQEGA